MTDYVLKHYRSDIESDCPLGRIGQESEIVGIMIYLASRAGAYTNGTVIPVDGGTSVRKVTGGGWPNLGAGLLIV